MDDEQIAAVLWEPSPELAAERLVEVALAAGSHDNVSAVIADVTPRADRLEGRLEALPG